MIMDVKGEYVGGPRCGERFVIDTIAPPLGRTVQHPSPAYQAGDEWHSYGLQLTAAVMNGQPVETTTYRYVYIKPDRAGA